MSTAQSAQSTTLSIDVTTMMIKGVPKRMTRNDLMQELNISGFQQLYDFCYLPQDVDSQQHKGYGFVNFVHTWTAQLFRSAWAKRMLTTSSGRSKPVDIVQSSVQGLRANMNKWCGPRTHSIRDPAQKPFLSPLSPTADTKQVLQAQRAVAEG
ncbi:ML5 [Symbiodinium natans]|uniref:ML5 protein n=1 Tax=Symbiodinium natans TaxID=878477 RepID=A0A812IIZ6_9DINO|nr:ML5 [Symbiodinium natans]